jgi:hypothetical protein
MNTGALPRSNIPRLEIEEGEGGFMLTPNFIISCGWYITLYYLASKK